MCQWSCANYFPQSPLPTPNRILDLVCSEEDYTQLLPSSKSVSMGNISLPPLTPESLQVSLKPVVPVAGTKVPKDFYKCDSGEQRGFKFQLYKYCNKGFSVPELLHNRQTTLRTKLSCKSSCQGQGFQVINVLRWYWDLKCIYWISVFMYYLCLSNV